jgi:hypothetical protein
MDVFNLNTSDIAEPLDSLDPFMPCGPVGFKDVH